MRDLLCPGSCGGFDESTGTQTTPSRTVVVDGVWYQIPINWKPGDGVPILEKIDLVNKIEPGGGTQGMPSWVWLAGAGIVAFMLLGGSGGKGRR